MNDNKSTNLRNYAPLIQQLVAMIEAEPDMIANMANTAAVLKQEFGFWWVGFYRVVDDSLVLGPFQGPVACTRIRFGRGVCGTAWQRGETIIVPDVHLFPGHIACSEVSRSEIVVPLKVDDKIVGVLDIDSANLNEFTSCDAIHLEQISKLLCKSSL